MARHTVFEMTLLKCVMLLLCLSGALCQRDCTGVDCPVLHGCIEEVLESGACCASCVQTGCACEGYQYYDCVNAGFKNGKVPEGDSYFVDYGSTECSCPEGGGRISCHFISCPEIPANCIQVSEPADGCVQCDRIGCDHDGQKYEAGHSFHLDPCQVCHCPNDGGKLMCYPVPDCDPQNFQKPMLATTTEENAQNKHLSDPYMFDGQGPMDHLSKPYRLSHRDNLPFFRPAPSHMDEEEEDYDYAPTDTPEPYADDLAYPTQFSITNRVISVSSADRTSPYQTYDTGARLELREKYGVHEHTTDRAEVEVTDSLETGKQTTSSLREDTTTTWQRHSESQTHPQRSSESQIHPQKRSESQIHPERSSESQIHPQRSSESQIHPERSSESQIHPERSSESQIHPERSSESQIHPQRSSESQIHPQRSSESQIHPERSSESQIHQQRSSESQIHPLEAGAVDLGDTHEEEMDEEVEEEEEEEEEEEKVITLLNVTGAEGRDVPYDIGIIKQESHTTSSHVNIPISHMNTPNSHIHTPNIHMNAPNSHMNTPNIHMNIPNSHSNTPNIHMNTPNIQMNAPNSHMNTPKIHMNTPNSHMNTPNIQMNTPNIQMNIPNSYVNTPNIQMNTTNSHRNTPNSYVNTPNSHMNTPNSHMNTPNIQMNTTNSHRNTPNSYVNTPNSHMNTPNSHMNTPNGHINTPNSHMNTPNIHMNIPTIQINTTNSRLNTPSSHMKSDGRDPGSNHEKTTVEHSTKSPRTPEHYTLPTVKFSPTSQQTLRVKADVGHPSKKQPQTLFNLHIVDTQEMDEEEVMEKEEEKRDNIPTFLPKPQGGVSAKYLVESCCKVGQRWASENHHCNNMPVLKDDEYSVCSVAQKQCCSGFLKENRCLVGMTAARGGVVCEMDNENHCTEDSYQVCCSCCALGLRLRGEGWGCDAHQYLGYPCGHIFLTCCEEEQGLGQPTLTKKEMPKPTALPKKVSDSKFPKEAFSIGDADEAANSVEEPEDVDECQLYQAQLCHHTCVNTRGSYHCGCRHGYMLLQDGHTCVAVSPEEDNSVREEDRLARDPIIPTAAPTTTTTVQHNPCTGNSPCMQQCTVVAGQAHCSCFPGFSLMADRHMCEDVNECRTGTHNCSRGDFCVNKEGSFQCVRLNEICDEGFIHNMNRDCVDVNECITNTHSCQSKERCVNTVGSFVCERQVTCPAGYQLRNGICEDIDECMVRTHNCGVGFECENTVGSFLCNPKHKCLTGFTQDSHGNCIDINECSSLTERCSAGFNCINTVGSYTCQRKIIMCSQGYHSSPDGARCIDVDECQTGIHRCGEGQICHNLPGSYRCDCQTGYQYDATRQVCTDVNECWRYPGRLCAQTCDNTPGSYQCSCTAGFSLAFDGKNCEDLNECDKNPCSQECANIYGSYQCYCRQGFYLKEDGHNCEDIDECSQSIGNLCAFQCVNVPGSYQCACPPHGYTMSTNGRTCRDIDECTTGGHNCSSDQTCYNIQGDFKCLSFACPQNYRKVSDTRCERNSCPTNSLDCQNSPLRITYYQLSFQTNIVIPAQIFRIGPSPAYSRDNIVISITRGNEEGYFSTRKLNSFTGAVYLQRQVRDPKDFLVDVEMKLLRQGSFTTFVARIYVFITANSI